MSLDQNRSLPAPHCTLGKQVCLNAAAGRDGGSEEEEEEEGEVEEEEEVKKSGGDEDTKVAAGQVERRPPGWGGDRKWFGDSLCVSQVDDLSLAERASLLRNDLRPAIKPFKGNKLLLRFATHGNTHSSSAVSSEEDLL